MARGVFFPTNSNGLALVYLVISCVTSKYPKAPKIQPYNLFRYEKRGVMTLYSTMYLISKI